MFQGWGLIQEHYIMSEEWEIDQESVVSSVKWELMAPNI